MGRLPQSFGVVLVVLPVVCQTDPGSSLSLDPLSTDKVSLLTALHYKCPGDTKLAILADPGFKSPYHLGALLTIPLALTVL